MKNNELIFYTSRGKAILLLLGAVALVASGWWIKEQKPLIGWLCMVFFALGIPAALVMLLPGVMYLRLDHEGFEMSSIGQKKKYLWRDIQSFKILSMRGAKMIGINFRQSFTEQKMARAVAGALSGMKGAIPNSYNVSLAELERVLNQWLERFGRVDT
jgi:hypothetical protein